MEYVSMIASPLGQILAASDGKSISGLWFEEQKYAKATLDVQVREGALPVFDDLKEWLAIYFAGKAPGFSVPVAPKGSAFRQRVWDVLCAVPYGAVTTYGKIAQQLATDTDGTRTSARAVGGAIAHNPISILIPCHRVIGSGGELTGYAGGLTRKFKLLKLENAPVDFSRFSDAQLYENV